MSKEITEAEIQKIRELGSLSPFESQIMHAKQNSDFLKKKADYNQIAVLANDIERLKQAEPETIEYLKWKAGNAQYTQRYYDGEINKKVLELREYKSKVKKSLDEGRRPELQSQIDGLLEKELEKLTLNTKEYEKQCEEKKEKITADILESEFQKELAKEVKEVEKDYESRINNANIEIQKRLSEKSFEETRVVWFSPTQSIEKDGSNQDQFIYSSNTKEKTVFIPFKEIHKRLIQDNYRVRNGEVVKNILVGSFVFVVSDRVHPDINKSNEKYNGGRTYVEVPIIVASNDLPIKTQKSSDHSEAALKEQLEQDTYIAGLVNSLKEKIKATLKINDTKNIKIYQNILFLNSELNACKGFGCSKTLYEMQRGVGDSKFLQKLQNKLHEEGFVMSRKEHGLGKYSDQTNMRLRMQVSYSADKPTASDGYFGNIHAVEALSALDDGNLYSSSIDIHHLDGEILLETPNWAICDIKKSEYDLAKQIRSERNALFSEEKIISKGLKAILQEEQDFQKRWQDELKPKNAIFGSGHATTKGFDLGSWGDKVFEQNNDTGRFLS